MSSGSARYSDYSVTDLSGSARPYIHSSTELGYFYSARGSYASGLFYSLDTALISSNGLMYVNTDGGFGFNRPGIYRISFSLDVPKAVTGVSAITETIGFGTVRLTSASPTALPAGSFLGQSKPTTGYSYTLGELNQTWPVLLNWRMDAYSRTNASLSTFITNSNYSNYLVYNFYNGVDSATGNTTSYICSGCIEFAVPTTTTIYYFNHCCNTQVTVGKSPFVAEFVSDTIPAVPPP